MLYQIQMMKNYGSMICVNVGFLKIGLLSDIFCSAHLPIYVSILDLFSFEGVENVVSLILYLLRNPQKDSRPGTDIIYRKKLETQTLSS